MAEFKFFCPQCGQHIQCDTGYAGRQINCPVCQQAIVVPSPTPVSTPATASPSLRRGTPVLAAEREPVPVKSCLVRNSLIVMAVVLILAGLIGGGWFGYLKIKMHSRIGTLPAGLVALWSAEGNANNNLGGCNGQLKNGAGFGSGKIGQAFNLNAGHPGRAERSRQFVLIPASSALDVGTGAGFTFACWIHPVTVTKQMLIAEYEQELGTANGADVGINFAIQASTVLYANITEAGGRLGHEISSPPNLLVAGAWQHIAMTYDKASGLAVLYINGTAVTQTNIGSFTPQTSFAYLLVGARTTYGSEAYPNTTFSGKIDELGIYDRALSAAEIQAIYAVQK